MKAYEIVSDGGVDALALNERPNPKPGFGQVLVRVRASSINYRDLSTIEDPVPRNIPYPRIPNSDGAGEVVEVGEGVTRWKAGDRVCGCFFQGWIDGDVNAELTTRALGGALDGMLTEYRVLGEDGLVALPDHMSFEEGATLPCAALTAWHSLVEVARVKSGTTVLLLGTGGVSVFALQFCKLMGVRTICTSSSDEKIERLKRMGADEVINYRTHPEWHEKVLELTNGKGVDHTVEVGGAGTLERSISATRIAGSIGLIGILTGGQVNPVAVMRKSIRLQGIYVGSRRMFEEMNAAISQHELKPVISETFDFADARDAFHAMRAAGHFGKLVVQI
ncbi:NAD(P)-dependent alcohol dehydrogenase [Nisaea acidiphila]|uniref:NAD(P)-dependent alcohol dehydrogenase n=1 Tax=Nisaea acidiphila TaxID=1862145 RepID=A0A9J7AU20_9PROT|nr:NAD(P)-dependent alcohol dehydrogenase [Nisaea acidiphila]UUX50598.1 NAD(P)-dependent alcohol dehydrogenase [Nisaea acidiphila]